MTLAELVELTREKLGGSAAFYPQDLVVTFLQYAQNVLSLSPQYRVRARAAYTLVAGELLIDMRALLPRYLSTRRVILGTVATEVASRSLGLVQPLFRTTLPALAARPRWLEVQDVPRQWFPHGKTLIGLWPRPTTSTTVTAVVNSLPTPFDVNNLEAESDIAASNHGFLSDVATGLLLLREGTLEGEKGVQMFQRALADQATRNLQQTLQRMQRQNSQLQAVQALRGDGLTGAALGTAVPTL